MVILVSSKLLFEVDVSIFERVIVAVSVLGCGKGVKLVLGLTLSQHVGSPRLIKWVKLSVCSKVSIIRLGWILTRLDLG